MLFTYYNCFTLLFIKWSVVLACSEVCAFFVHTKCIPCCRTIDIFLRNIVHGYRNSQHRAHCDKICTNVSVGDCSMVCTPVVHYIISCLERSFFAIASWSKPCLLYTSSAVHYITAAVVDDKRYFHSDQE